MDFNTDLNLVVQDIGIAKGLPNEHYIDNQIYEEEKKALII